MVSPALTNILKTIEELPESTQNKLAEHLREYLADLEDEELWDEAFEKTQDQLARLTREAEKRIEEGKSEPMDFSRL
jgi:DNA phosphorothioation-dependent restriction protein DptG